MVTISFRDVTFRYPGAAEPALAGLTLELPSRGVTVVTGPLGAGCSTLLLLAAGLAPRVTGGVRDGIVLAGGVDPGDDRHRGALAGRVVLLTPTPAAQLSGMAFTVWDEVAFGPANLGWERPRIGDAVDRALELTDTGALASRDPVTLSGGELQRVMLAGCLAMEPEVLLLDEPALELDPVGASRLFALLPDLGSRAAVVVATSDVDRAWRIADRMVVLAPGRLLASGRPDDVLVTDAAAAAGATTAAGYVFREAGFDPPYPLGPDAAAARLRDLPA